MTVTKIIIIIILSGIGSQRRFEVKRGDVKNVKWLQVDCWECAEEKSPASALNFVFGRKHCKNILVLTSIIYIKLVPHCKQAVSRL